MRLGFIAHEVHRRGGMERAAAEVLARVAAVHDVVVIANVCEISGRGLRWVPIRRGARLGPLTYLNFARQASAMAKAEQCTITHSLGADAAAADIVTAQFCFAAFQATCGAARGGRNPLRRAMHWSLQEIFARREREVYGAPRLKRVIAVSQGLRRELVEYYGVDDARISVIPNGVDHTVFRPCPTPLAKQRLRTALGLPESSFIALFVGGDWHRKGVADAIEAVGGMADTSLVVLGRGREELFREVAERAGAAAKVFFVQPSATPQEYYAAADVFVFPSRYEAFSLATLEASAAGLPILALRINGTEELIDDGVNGFFVEPSPDSIRQRLVLLRDDTAGRLAMSGASLETSRAYGWDRIAAQHLGLLAAVAAERN